MKKLKKIALISSVVLTFFVGVLVLVLCNHDYTKAQERDVLTQQVLIHTGEGGQAAEAMSTDSEKIYLTGDDDKTATAFTVTDVYPGDVITKQYTVTVNDNTATALDFSAEYFDATENATDAQKNRDRSLMNLTVTANGIEVYNGPLGDVTSANSYKMNGKEKVVYELKVTLDTAAGNEYARLSQALTLHWTLSYEQVYYISFSDGMGGTVFPSQVYVIKEGDPTPKFVGTPTRNGYRFVGWSPALAPTVTKDVVYTAVWEQLYTVTYTDGTGQELYFKDQVYSGLTKDSVRPSFVGIPTREGYRFKGWNPELTNSVTSSVVYTAQWEELEPSGGDTFTIRYTDGVDDEEWFEDAVFENIKKGDPTPEYPGRLFRTGYTFAGWSPERSDTVDGDVTYTAIWKEGEIIEYTFDDDHRRFDHEIDIPGPRGGDEQIARYRFTVNHEDGMVITIVPEIDGIPEELRDKTTIKIICEDTGEVIYEGLVSDLPETIPFFTTYEDSETYTFTAKVSVDDSVGNEYADKTLRAGLSFRGRGKCRHYRYCIICAGLYHHYGIPRIFPICLIIYILIILHIWMYIKGYRITKKERKAYAEFGFTKEQIKEKVAKKRQYIWLGIKKTFHKYKNEELEALEEARRNGEK